MPTTEEDWIAGNRAQNINCKRRRENHSPPWCEEVEKLATPMLQDLAPTGMLNGEWANWYKAFLRKVVDITKLNNTPCRECTYDFLIANWLHNLIDLSAGSSDGHKREGEYIRNDKTPKDEFIDNLFNELIR